MFVLDIMNTHPVIKQIVEKLDKNLEITQTEIVDSLREITNGLWETQIKNGSSIFINSDIISLFDAFFNTGRELNSRATIIRPGRNLMYAEYTIITGVTKSIINGTIYRRKDQLNIEFNGQGIKLQCTRNK